MKILVIRFSSIGDIILTSPVIRCLSKQLNATIHFLTKPEYHSLVGHNPYVNKVHLFSSYKESEPELRAENFDLVIDLHNNIRSNKVSKSLGVQSHSYNKQSIKRLMLVNFKWDLLKGSHIVDRYFSAVKKLNIQNDQKGIDFYYPKQNLKNLPVEYLVISIGTAHLTKDLPKKLIERLIAAYDIPIVLIGGKQHRGFAETLDYASKNVHDLVGKTSLIESAEIIDQAKLLISPDTGMMHLAAALKTPTIAIYGSTSSKLGFTPYMDESLFRIVENEALSCRPCTKQGRSICPKGHLKCMNNLDFREIIEKSEQLVDL